MEWCQRASNPNPHPPQRHRDILQGIFFFFFFFYKISLFFYWNGLKNLQSKPLSIYKATVRKLWAICVLSMSGKIWPLSFVKWTNNLYFDSVAFVSLIWQSAEGGSYFPELNFSFSKLASQRIKTFSQAIGSQSHKHCKFDFWINISLMILEMEKSNLRTQIEHLDSLRTTCLCAVLWLGLLHFKGLIRRLCCLVANLNILAG